MTYGMPADLTSMVLPTTGEETRATQGLEVFGKLAAAWVVFDCARQHGETLPDGPPPMFTRYSMLPDLEFLRVHGFDGGTFAPGAPPARRDSSDGAATPGAELRRCMDRATPVTRELQQVYAPLQSQWFARLAPLDRDPTVRKAYRSFARCLGDHHVNAKDENDFFGLVDQRLQASDTSGSRRLAAVYATCMKPVEAARKPLRNDLARKFRVTHAEEIAQVRAELPEKVHEMEKGYRIRFSIPKL
ncbi:hypothetical protein [Streptomyces sp. NPDC101165]|uniref:hypothetical protein n=1 Tax=Streptomyces sp. NPDC101165 TaxID=3366119 RepID=UPI003816431C